MKVRIYDNQPNAAQRRSLKQECVKEFDKLLELYNHQVAVQVLHILRFDFGFGQQRLKQFADKMAEMQIRNIEQYEMLEDDVPWLCEHKLKESGIDLDAIFKRS